MYDIMHITWPRKLVGHGGKLALYYRGEICEICEIFTNLSQIYHTYNKGRYNPGYIVPRSILPRPLNAFI